MATLILEADEKERFEAWKKEHGAVCGLRPGTCGDLYSFHVVPSGIGMFVAVRCPCGARYDLTGNL